MPPVAESPQQQAVIEESDGSNRSNRSISPLQNQQSQLTAAIDKALLDDKGRNKGYFTKGDFVYHTLMMPNLRWTEDQAEHRLYALLVNGTIEEIEPDRFRPKLES